MAFKVTNWRMSPAATLAVACALSAGIVLLRFADDRAVDAILFLLILPIGLIAAQFGWAAGLTAALVALGLVGVWVGVRDVDLGPLGYLTRAVVFLYAGTTMGLLPRPARGDLEDRPGDGFSSPPGVTGELKAEVVRFSENDHIILSFDEGREIALPLPAAIRDKLDVGSPAVVYFDRGDVPVGLYLPAADFGIDLRGYERDM